MAIAWNKYRDEFHALAVEKGWWPDERPVEEILNLCCSELFEALDEYRNGNGNFYYSENDKPEGKITELADCVIRELDYCGRHNIDIEAAISGIGELHPAKDFQALIFRCNAELVRAYSPLQRTQRFALVISLIKRWCDDMGEDLETIMQIKHAYNRGRSWRHNGKLC